MSIFKEHKTSADRSASDRRRHKEKITKAIREGVYNIVSDESIIGKDGKKRIKIPVRGIKEYRFIYGDNEKNKKVGSAPGKDIRRGQTLRKKQKDEKDKGDKKPGFEPGEEFYEVEITLEELSYYLFESLNLPQLEKKKFKNIVGDRLKRSGYRNFGIRPRLSKKETLKRKIRRKKRAISEGLFDPDSDQRFPFHEDDKKYRHIKVSPRENSNAVIFFVMDVSGSMGKEKKFMARSFFFLLYHFLRYRYNNVEIVFVSHTSDAKEVTEDEFFTRGSSGGTFISAGVEKCLEISKSRYHVDTWNTYVFHCSDGDNWPQDNEKSIMLSRELLKRCQLYSFIEIIPSDDDKERWFQKGGTMSDIYSPLVGDTFKVVRIESPDDVWKEFKRIFGGKLNE